jgi:hypothetical protein
MVWHLADSSWLLWDGNRRRGQIRLTDYTVSSTFAPHRWQVSPEGIRALDEDSDFWDTYAVQPILDLGQA